MPGTRFAYGNSLQQSDYSNRRDGPSQRVVPYDPLALFSAEPAARPVKKAVVAAAAPLHRHGTSVVWLLCGAAMGIALARILPATLMQPQPTPIVDGRLDVATIPVGLPVTIDGSHRGLTPITLPLAPGAHTLSLGGTVPRTIPFTIAAGEHASTYLEFAASPAGGGGTAPAAGGAPTSQLERHARPVIATAGWLSISSPFLVQVFEGAALLGASGAKLTLTPGRHDVRLVNNALRYEEHRTVNVAAGKLSSLRIDAPKSTIDINALPWADVSIDGENIGQTPLGRVPVTIGTHNVQFRHPQLGEQRRTITVTATGPNRIAVDLTTK